MSRRLGGIKRLQIQNLLVLYHTSRRFKKKRMNTSSRHLEHPGGIIGCKDKRAPMVLIVALGHQCSIMSGQFFTVAQFIF